MSNDALRTGIEVGAPPTKEFPRFVKNPKTGSWEHASKPEIDVVFERLKEHLKLNPSLITRIPETGNKLEMAPEERLALITPQLGHMFSLAESLLDLVRMLRGLLG